MKVHAEFGSPVYIRESGLGGEGSLSFVISPPYLLQKESPNQNSAIAQRDTMKAPIPQQIADSEETKSA